MMAAWVLIFTMLVATDILLALLLVRSILAIARRFRRPRAGVVRASLVASLLVASWGSLLLFAEDAGADDTIVVSWTLPTHYVDGAPLPLTEIASTRVEYGSCFDDAPTFGTKQGERIVPGPGVTVGVMRPPGTTCFRASVRATNLLESAFSAVASATLPAPPLPPAGLVLIVQPDRTAYTVTQSRDRLGLVAVGTVAPDTQCDETQPVLGKFVVPRAAVTFASNVQPQVVVATCG